MSNEELVKQVEAHPDPTVKEVAKRFALALVQLAKPQLYSKAELVLNTVDELTKPAKAKPSAPARVTRKQRKQS